MATHMQKLHILAVSLALAVAACAPPPIAQTTTTTSTTVTSPTIGEVTVTGCEDAPETFAILCEAADLIDRYYLEEVSTRTLAAAAQQAVAGIEDAPRSPGPFTCAIPDEAFRPLCETIDDEDLDPGYAVDAVLSGITQLALDPNSVYFDPEAFELLAEEQTGTVEGIGALVSSEDRTAEDPESTPCSVITDTCRMVIITPLEGSPADAAGIEPGDELLRVDGRDIRGHTIDEVTALVRGPAGSEVTLEFEREGEIVEFTITRDAIDIPVVSSERFGDVGYVRLTLFTDNADELLHSELLNLGAQDLETVIFDLRDNPGGSLDAAIGVASEFFDDGLVLRTIYPDTEEIYEVEPNGTLVDQSIELIVLVNAGSASASEVVAGMLQERDRAVVIGEPTFGKNTVQQRFQLSNGGALKLTIAKWVTPERSDFGGTGVQPDIPLEIDRSLGADEVVDLVLSAVA